VKLHVGEVIGPILNGIEAVLASLERVVDRSRTGGVEERCGDAGNRKKLHDDRERGGSRGQCCSGMLQYCSTQRPLILSPPTKSTKSSPCLSATKLIPSHPDFLTVILIAPQEEPRANQPASMPIPRGTFPTNVVLMYLLMHGGRTCCNTISELLKIRRYGGLPRSMESFRAALAQAFQLDKLNRYGCRHRFLFPGSRQPSRVGIRPMTASWEGACMS
jgi:hypothetical protein